MCSTVTAGYMRDRYKFCYQNSSPWSPRAVCRAWGGGPSSYFYTVAPVRLANTVPVQPKNNKIIKVKNYSQHKSLTWRMNSSGVKNVGSSNVNPDPLSGRPPMEPDPHKGCGSGRPCKLHPDPHHWLAVCGVYTSWTVDSPSPFLERWLNLTSISFLGLMDRCQYLEC